MQIGPKKVGESPDVFVIAEVGNNHNGDFDRAVELINQAKQIGADCVKFQMRFMDSVYRQKSLNKAGEDLTVEYTIDLLNRFELDKESHVKLKQICDEIGIIYLCTPWDSRSVMFLNQMDVMAFKVASADFTNLPLIDVLISTGKPLIFSTGMTREEEIDEVVAYLKDRAVQFSLLHCNSTYPAPWQDINLGFIKTLLSKHDIVGYSGHERGIAVSLGAVALGAKIIERHLTLDRSMEGPDHAASLEPADFTRLIEGIRELEQALGNGGKRKVSQGEMMNRENLAKSLVAAKSLRKGDVILREDIAVLSPGQGLSPLRINDLVGISLKRDMESEDFFFPSDLSDTIVNPRAYKFSRPWGVPVRYHDFNEYFNLVPVPLFEFHLSYSDMDLDPGEFLRGPYEADFVVHAPELFAGSHLMDLASPDDDYRKQSASETQRVIDITRRLKSFFPNTERPLIVANVGGITRDANLAPNEVPVYYERFYETLQTLDLDGVELIPQTMAPFPWHFGGQRYQNLFVKPDEIVEYCQRFGLRMCFDVSHSMLTCNHFGLDFYNFARSVGSVTAHLHLGDAQGINGEGLQIGMGEIDFDTLGKILGKVCPRASFIPEIWQGHKNGGEGFWTALEKLEGQL